MVVWLIRHNNLRSFCNLYYICWCLKYFFTCLHYDFKACLQIFTQMTSGLTWEHNIKCIHTVNCNGLNGKWRVFLPICHGHEKLWQEKHNASYERYSNVSRSQWCGWIFAATHRFESPLTGLSKRTWGSSRFVDPIGFNCILVCPYFQSLMAAVRRKSLHIVRI